MSHSDKIFVFYNKKTLEIIFIQEPQGINLSPDTFLHERYSIERKCIGLPKEDFAVIVSDREPYQKYLNDINSYFLRIDASKNEIEYVLKKKDVFNSTYNDQEIKRSFSVSQITEMYHNDYIDFNLKNFLKTGYAEAVFLPLNKINVNLHMLNRNWKYFHNDQFLSDSHEDKRILGQNIYKNGTYWPVIVSPLYGHDTENSYVYEGTHRILSLKLNQKEGLIPQDYKILCIKYKECYEVLINSKRFMPISNFYRARSLIEILYGNNVIVDEEKYKTCVDDCLKNNGEMKNEYTVEWDIKSIGDSIFALQTYPHWLRDLIYPVTDIIKPSPILNNEELFVKWLND
jgi:hypothetical protein